MNATNTTTSQLPPHVVKAMYAPAAFTASGWLLALLGYAGDSVGLGLLGVMAALCGLVMAGPMAVIALYRAMKVDTRPVIWWAAVLDALALAGSGAVLVVAST